ncbi:hypothetical protein FBU31_004161 [Coemansia sp. 'formosensis']|nr:hypothetical protein FBU31_004161 [Coemansia sp. 'formosensis']
MTNLTAGGLDLGGGTTGLHLADPLGSLGGGGGAGGLLLGGLLLAGGLQLGDGRFASSRTDLGLLVTARVDGVQRKTDDGTAVLDVAARALLGNLLADTLAVDLAEDRRPCQLARVLVLVEQRLGLRVEEVERLAVSTNERATAAGIHLVSGKGADLEPTKNI